MVDVAVVMPSKDEWETIGDCIEKARLALNYLGLKGEVVVADNSKDDTPLIARKLGASVVTPDRMGYGYAYRYAFKYLKTKYGHYPKYVVIGDADGTYDFSEIPKLLEPLMRGEADLVVGSRLRGKIEKGAMPWYRRWIGNPLLTSFLNVFYKVGVSDAHSGFRAIRGDALGRLELRSDGMEFASEMLIEAARKKLRIAEVPITYRRRVYGRSKLSSLRDGWRHLRFMFMYAPNYLYMYPGALLMIAGAVLFASCLLRVSLGYSLGIHTSIISSLLLVVGFQTLLFGAFTKLLLGEELPRFLAPEKSLTIGVAMLVAGSAGIAKIGFDWIASGFRLLPPAAYSVLYLTLIALGLQALLSSFMASVIAERKRE